MKRLTIVALLATLIFVGACSKDDPAVDAGAGAGTSTADHNDADVTFAQDMIPHHEGALDMARLAGTRAASAKVKDLAARIEVAQAPEIKLMQGWLEDWGEPDAPADDGMDHGDNSDEPAMSTSDMSELEAASGAEFDRMFLTAMIEHHKSAVAMATTEVDAGKFPAAVALATTIKSSQEAEIAEMEGLVKEPG